MIKLTNKEKGRILGGGAHVVIEPNGDDGD